MGDISKLLAPESRASTLRKVGGLLFGLGMFMVFLRKGTSYFPGDRWGDFALFITLLVPAAVLYGLGYSAAGGDDEPSSWRPVLVVFGLLLVPITCAQFIELLNGTPGADLNLVWFFGLTAALAFAASVRRNVMFATLFGGLAVIVAWTALWDKIIGLGDDIATYRWLLLLLAVLFAACAASWARRGDDMNRRRSGEMMTAAGISGVIAGAISVSILGNLSVASPFSIPGTKPNLWWDGVLLVISLALVVYGSRGGFRGSMYVGGFGLLFFLLSAGLDLDATTRHGDLIGWPLVLLILGVGALAASFMSGSGGSAPSAPPPPSPTEASPPPPAAQPPG